MTGYEFPHLNLPKVSGHSLKAVDLAPPLAVCSCGAPFDAFGEGALNKFRDHIFWEAAHG